MTTRKTSPRANSRAKVEEEPTEEIVLTKCQKEGSNCHWRIEAPNGPESTGTCRKCGAKKQFRNSFEYSSWYGAKAAGGRGRGRPRKTSR
jgi:hypothetical protein